LGLLAYTFLEIRHCFGVPFENEIVLLAKVAAKAGLRDRGRVNTRRKPETGVWVVATENQTADTGAVADDSAVLRWIAGQWIA
jgi:hypothetical protein